MARKLHYVAGEGDALYLHALRNRFLRTPNVTVCELHPEEPADYEPGAGQFDTALCVNVLESVKDPARGFDIAADLSGSGRIGAGAGPAGKRIVWIAR